MSEGETGKDGEGLFSELPKPETVGIFEEAARQSTSMSKTPGFELVRLEDGRTLVVHTFPPCWSKSRSSSG